MTIHCRILRVNLDKFSVDLTCKSSDLADEEGKFRSVVGCLKTSWKFSFISNAFCRCVCVCVCVCVQCS